MVLVGLCFPAAALAKRQYTIDPKTGKKLIAAQEAFQAEQYTEAQKILRSFRIDRLNPYEAAVVYQLTGFAAANLEQYADATKAFEKCLEQEALPPEGQNQVRFTMAQLYLIQGRFDDAIRNFELWFAATESPTSRAYYMLAVAYYQAGSPDKALEPAKQAVELSEEPKERWLQLLLSLYITEKRYDQSLPLLEQLVTRFPKKVYWVQLAAVYAELGRDELSLAAQQLAYAQGLLTTDRELVRLAQMYLYYDLPYRAAILVEKGLADGSIESNSKSWKLLGDAWVAAREYEKSLGPLAKAAQLADDGELYERLGQVYIQREEWAEAIAALAKAVEKGGLKDPGNPHLLTGIGLYNQGNKSAARAAFQRAGQHEDTKEASQRWLDFLEREAQRGA